MRINEDLEHRIVEEIKKRTPRDRIRRMLIYEGYSEHDADEIIADLIKKEVSIYRDTARKKIILGAFAIFVLAGLAFGLLYLPYRLSQEGQISYGYPDNLPYGLPPLSGQDVSFSQQEMRPAVCTSNGALVCTSPVSVSFFVQNSRTSISRYEQYVHLLLKNTGPYASNISFSLDSELLCSSVAASFNLASGSASERLDILCINHEHTNTFNSTWRARYTENGMKKESSGTLRTIW